jgi:hypothetical protein
MDCAVFGGIRIGAAGVHSVIYNGKLHANRASVDANGRRHGIEIGLKHPLSLKNIGRGL